MTDPMLEDFYAAGRDIDRARRNRIRMRRRTTPVATIAALAILAGVLAFAVIAKMGMWFVEVFV